MERKTTTKKKKKKPEADEEAKIRFFACGRERNQIKSDERKNKNMMMKKK